MHAQVTSVLTSYLSYQEPTVLAWLFVWDKKSLKSKYVSLTACLFQWHTEFIFDIIFMFIAPSRGFREFLGPIGWTESSTGTGEKSGITCSIFFLTNPVRIAIPAAAEERRTCLLFWHGRGFRESAQPQCREEMVSEWIDMTVQLAASWEVEFIMNTVDDMTSILHSFNSGRGRCFREIAGYNTETASQFGSVLMVSHWWQLHQSGTCVMC